MLKIHHDGDFGDDASHGIKENG